MKRQPFRTNLGLEILEERTLLSGTTVIVPTTGSVSVNGTIATAAAVHKYNFTASQSGYTLVAQAARNSSGLDSYLSASSAGGTLLDSNDNAYAATLNSLVLFAVVAGQSYTVDATDSNNSTGAYSLTFTYDDFGNTFATAYALALPASGTTQTGTIELPGDLDMFAVTAPVSGYLDAVLTATGSSTQTPRLHIYDSGQNLLANTNGSPDELVVPATAGQVYYVTASAVAGGTGTYSLALTPIQDDYTTFATADPLTLSSLGGAKTTGTIQVPIEVVIYTFQATVTGTMTAKLSSTNGLVPSVSAFDANDNSLASEANKRGAADSTVTFDVVAGQTYFVEAASAATATDPTGSYTLKLSTDAPSSPGSPFGGGPTLGGKSTSTLSTITTVQTAQASFAEVSVVVTGVNPPPTPKTPSPAAAPTLVTVPVGTKASAAPTTPTTAPTPPPNSEEATIVVSAVKPITNQATTATTPLFGDVTQFLNSSAEQRTISAVALSGQENASLGTTSFQLFSIVRPESSSSVHADVTDATTPNYDAALAAGFSDNANASIDAPEQHTELVGRGLPVVQERSETSRSNADYGTERQPSSSLLVPLPRRPAALVPILQLPAVPLEEIVPTTESSRRVPGGHRQQRGEDSAWSQFWRSADSEDMTQGILAAVCLGAFGGVVTERSRSRTRLPN